MKKYPDHEYAQIFPMASAEDKARLRQSLEKTGQLKAVVLLDDKVLDGRNRQDILIDDLNQEPLYIKFEDLAPEVVARGPLEYVMGENFARRNLTPGQLAIIAAELIPLFEKEAREHQVSGLRRGSSPPVGGDGVSQETGFDPADEDQSKRASKRAAQATGASQRSTERARQLLKSDPKKAAAVKAATLSLNKATRDVGKEKAKASQIEEAQKRVQSVCGKTYADHMKAGEYLKDTRELLAFADMSDADMMKTKGLVASGFTLARAKKYRMTALSRTNTISDLCMRCLAQGGKLSLDVEYQGHKIGVYANEYPKGAKLPV